MEDFRGTLSTWFLKVNCWGSNWNDRLFVGPNVKGQRGAFKGMEEILFGVSELLVFREQAFVPTSLPVLDVQ